MHDPMDRDSSLDDLAKPVKSVEEKWKLLHIDSFNHFTNDDDRSCIQRSELQV